MKNIFNFEILSLDSNVVPSWNESAPSRRVSELCSLRGQRGAEGWVKCDTFTIINLYPPLIVTVPQHAPPIQMSGTRGQRRGGRELTN